MVKHCCVYGCRSESYAGCNISFHGFPKNEEMRQKWLANIHGKQKISKYSVVCGLHFAPSCFDNANSRRLLKADAVPQQVVETDDDSIDEDEEDNKNLLILKERLTSGGNCGPLEQTQDDTDSDDEQPQKFEMVIPSCNSTMCNCVPKKPIEMKSISTQVSRPTDGEAGLRQRVKVLGMRLKRRDDKVYYLQTVLNMIKKNFKGTDMEYKLSCELENITNSSESIKQSIKIKKNMKPAKPASPVDDCVNDEESSGDENGAFCEVVLSPNLGPRNSASF